MKKFISWDELDKLVDELCDMIPDNQYEGIYAIPKRWFDYRCDDESQIRTYPMIDRLQSYYGKKFLIVDDIADTGKTLEKLRAEVYKEAHTATILSQTIFSRTPFWVEEKGDDWIVYPWRK